MADQFPSSPPSAAAPAHVNGPDYAAPHQPRNWFSRNWTWLLGCGCVSILVGAGSVVLLIVWLAFSALKGSDAYQFALQQVQNSPAAQQQLGTPIVAGYSVTGEVQFHNGSGTAALTFPVSGPNGNGTVKVQATRNNGHWTITSLVLEVNGQPAPVVLVGAGWGPGTPVEQVPALDSTPGQESNGSHPMLVPGVRSGSPPASTRQPIAGEGLLEGYIAEHGCYSLRYPADWILERPQANALQIYPRGGDPARFCIALQYLPLEQQAASAEQTLLQVAAQFGQTLVAQCPGTQLAAVTNRQVDGQACKEFTADVPLNGAMLKQMFVLTLDARGQGVCVMFCRVPADGADEQLAKARSILKTWRLRAPAHTTGHYFKIAHEFLTDALEGRYAQALLRGGPDFQRTCNEGFLKSMHEYFNKAGGSKLISRSCSARGGEVVGVLLIFQLANGRRMRMELEFLDGQLSRLAGREEL